MIQSKKKMSREYPTRPALGVGAIILERDRVLLVKRGREPLKGLWSIPGGLLEIGEKLEHGLRREVREEVGLEIRIVELVKVFERIVPDSEGRIAYHYVLLDYLCEPAGGRLQPADDAADAAWVERGRLADYEITEGTPAVIEEAFLLRDELAVRS